MEFQCKLIILLTLNFIVDCCQPTYTDRCPKSNSIQACAMLFDKHNCGGRLYVIAESEIRLDKKVMSYVVRDNCILTVWRSDLGRVWKRTGVFSWYVSPGQMQGAKDHHMEYLDCNCDTHNTYKGCLNNNLNTRTEDNKSMCAKLYMHATDDPNTSCFGRSKEIYNGERSRSFDNFIWYDEISSIIVRKGCKFTGYEHANFDGDRKAFSGVTALLGDMNDRISSYICECEFPAIECIPSDSWNKIKECSNPDSSLMTCQHWASHGVSIGSSSTTEHGVTQNIEFTFGLELKKVFNLGFTSNTGYNWKTTSATSRTESDETRSVVTFTVPPGETYALYQLWGKCGQSAVKTQYYEVRNIRTAEVVERKGDNSS